MAEATTAVVAIESIDFSPHHFDDFLYDQLRDAIAALHHVVGGGIGVEENHLDLAPIRAIDQTRTVDHGDSVFQRQTTTWQHERGVSAR